MGLEWQDVDFKNGILSINRSSQYLSDMGVLQKHLKQKVPLEKLQYPNLLFLLLEEYKLWYEEQKIDLRRIMD